MEEYLDVIDRFIKVCDEDLYTEIEIKCDGLTRKAIEELAKAYRELENKYKFYENMEQKYFEISKELSALNSEYFKLKQKLEEKNANI